MVGPGLSSSRTKPVPPLPAVEGLSVPPWSEDHAATERPVPRSWAPPGRRGGRVPGEERRRRKRGGTPDLLVGRRAAGGPGRGRRRSGRCPARGLHPGGGPPERRAAGGDEGGGAVTRARSSAAGPPVVREIQRRRRSRPPPTRARREVVAGRGAARARSRRTTGPYRAPFNEQHTADLGEHKPSWAGAPSPTRHGGLQVRSRPDQNAVRRQDVPNIPFARRPGGEIDRVEAERTPSPGSDTLTDSIWTTQRDRSDHKWPWRADRGGARHRIRFWSGHGRTLTRLPAVIRAL